VVTAIIATIATIIIHPRRPASRQRKCNAMVSISSVFKSELNTGIGSRLLVQRAAIWYGN
jgi:hypothetical protein